MASVGFFDGFLVMTAEELGNVVMAGFGGRVGSLVPVGFFVGFFVEVGFFCGPVFTVTLLVDSPTMSTFSRSSKFPCNYWTIFSTKTCILSSNVLSTT